jgi:hypothetical protein
MAEGKVAVVKLYCLSRYFKKTKITCRLVERFHMKSIILSLAFMGAFGVAANAEPVKLSKAQMDRVVAGAITEQRNNPAGNPTQGQGNAITVTNVNPSGKAPPGQN